MKKKIFTITVFFLVTLFLLTNCKNIIGPSLPSEIQGEWGKSSTYYYLTFEFTKNHVYYHDYASNTGASTDWDNEVSEIIDEESFKAGSYYYYFHVSGSTLYLIKDRDPQTLGSNWWDEEGVTVGYILTKE